MANRYRSVKDPEVVRGFRHVNDIETLSAQELEEHGYYIGFSCPHNHFIRDSQNHWCYFCVKKILSNVCGFDINYLHTDYKIKYKRLWSQLQIGDRDDCWEVKSESIYTPKRVCMPSYRSLYSKQKSEGITFQKAIYQCAWGDIGTSVVTRICGNPRCGNPLHLVSSWNRLYPPSFIHPFEMDFVPEKLMHYSRRKGDPDLAHSLFKNTISNPLEHLENDE